MLVKSQTNSGTSSSLSLLPAQAVASSGAKDVYGKLTIVDGSLQQSLADLQSRRQVTFVKPSKEVEAKAKLIDKLDKVIVQLTQNIDGLDEFFRLANISDLRIPEASEEWTKFFKELVHIANSSWVKNAYIKLTEWQEARLNFLHDSENIPNKDLKEAYLKENKKLVPLYNAAIEQIVEGTKPIADLRIFFAPIEERNGFLSCVDPKVQSDILEVVRAGKTVSDDLKKSISFALLKTYSYDKRASSKDKLMMRTFPALQSYSMDALGILLIDSSRALEVFTEIRTYFSAMRQYWQSELDELIESQAREREKAVVSARAPVSVLLPDRVLQLEQSLQKSWIRFCEDRSTLNKKDPSAKIGYLLEESTRDSFPRFSEYLERVAWPHLRSQKEILPGVEAALQLCGISMQELRSIHDKAVVESSAVGDGVALPNNLRSVEDAKHNRLNDLLGSVTARDILDTKRHIMAAVEDEDVCRRILIQYPKLFAILHSSSANNDLFGEFCFDLLKINQEELERKSAAAKSLMECMEVLSCEDGKERLDKVLEAVARPSPAADKLLAELYAKVIRATAVSREVLTPAKKIAAVVKHKEKDPSQIQSERRKLLRSILISAGEEKRVESLLSHNPGLLQGSEADFSRYTEVLRAVLDLYQHNFRDDLSLSSNPAAFASTAALSKSHEIYLKQAEFNQIMKSLEDNYGEDAPYVFNLARKGFYRAGDFWIGRMLDDRHIFDNARKGPIVRLAAEDQFNSSSEDAMRYLAAHGAVNRARGSATINASAIGGNGSSEAGVIGRMLNFIIREISAADTFAFKKIYL